MNRLNLAGDGGADRRLLSRLILICGLVMGSGTAVAMLTRTNITPSTTLGEVSEAHIVEIRDRRGLTVLSGEFRSRIDALGNTEKDAVLIDRRGRSVIGEVELEIPAASRAHRRVELEVDVVGLQPRRRFAVVIDDRSVGTFTTDDRGSFDMELQEGE